MSVLNIRQTVDRACRSVNELRLMSGDLAPDDVVVSTVADRMEAAAMVEERALYTFDDGSLRVERLA